MEISIAMEFIAYMDPGTGSLFLQLLLGGVAGLAVVLKLYWRRLLVLLGLRKEEKPSVENPPLEENLASNKD